jgi:heme exporter protein C
MIKQHWWKALSVFILTIVIILGFLVPLKPGVLSVTPFSVETGQSVQLKVTGYNTFFKAANTIETWLKIDEKHALKANQFQVINDQELILTFDIPEQLPVPSAVSDAALIINSDIDGAFVRPSAIAIRQKVDIGDRSEASIIWQSNPIANLKTLDAFRFPFRNILSESIRNTYFHIPMWFGMILIFLYATILAFKYLRAPSYELDSKITSLIGVGILFGLLGLATGALWARHTWGDYWSGDIKQNMSLICLLIYTAYFILRASMTDPQRKGRLSAAYSIFAFVAMIPLLFIIPRMQDSLHPGSGGNPALGGEDLDNTMRMIFYPAIIGWTLFGLWIANLRARYDRLLHKQLENEMNR